MSNFTMYFTGWELLQKIIENEIFRKEDVLIALAHFVLTRHMYLRCLGLGDDRTLPENEERESTELLPDHWNADGNNYVLRYVYNKNIYILFGTRNGTSLVMSLLDATTKKVSNICLSPETTVKQLTGKLWDTVPEALQICERMRLELIKPVFNGPNQTQHTNQTEASTQTDPSPSSYTMGSRDRHFPGRFGSPFSEERPFGFHEYGRGDLDPFGRGGGSLFPSPTRPDFRRGSGPSGGMRPRHDPFGPGGPNSEPGPDHLRRFEDDYFM